MPPASRIATAAILAALTAISPGQDLVVVGSKNFTENRLLAEVMAQLLEARTDLKVVRRINLGGTMVVASALRHGEIDIYPEYTGTAWAIHLGISARAADPLAVYCHVAREYEKRLGITWLDPLGFSNSYAIAVSESFAERWNLFRISDLLPHAHRIRAGVSHEFLNRDDGYPGLAAAYGLDIPGLRGMEHGLAYAALDSGRIDLIDTWTTDGKLKRYAVRILDDDLDFFPPYDCAPIVRTKVLRAHPEIGEVLGLLAFRLSNERMQDLNHQVEVLNLAFDEVASRFIDSVDWDAGWMDSGTAASPDAGVAPGRRDADLIPFLRGQLPQVLRLAGDHLALTLSAVLLAVLTAVPTGILLTRRPGLATPILSAAGVIQTVPSLALLAFFIPVFGLGIPAAMAALFLYALLPILRNTYTGIKEVDAEFVDAARAMGLRDGEILRHVELPLAVRTIMGGVRTATVISVGIATLAAFIGVGGLGDPIVTGLQLDSTRLILSGAIPAAILAVLIDSILGRIERRLAGRRV